MFHIFSLVCFLIYGVKRRQVLIAKPHFYLYVFRFYIFYIFIINFMMFHQSVNFKPRLRFAQGATKHLTVLRKQFSHEKSIFDPKNIPTHFVKKFVPVNPFVGAPTKPWPGPPL